MLFVFIFDFFKNISTGLYHKGDLIKDRKFIFIHYIKTSVIYDIMGIASAIASETMIPDMND